MQEDGEAHGDKENALITDAPQQLVGRTFAHMPSMKS